VWCRVCLLSTCRLRCMWIDMRCVCVHVMTLTGACTLCIKGHACCSSSTTALCDVSAPWWCSGWNAVLYQACHACKKERSC
jgi:hypothetical protein